MFAEETGQPTIVSQSVAPEANSFICFEVGNFTYHEVICIVFCFFFLNKEYFNFFFFLRNYVF